MRLNSLNLLASVIVLGAALAAPTVQAQAFDAVRLYGAASGRDLGLAGAAVVAGAAYQGSDKRRTMLLPLLDYQWANGWFAGTSNGVGYNFSTAKATDYGVRITADLGRPQSRSDRLRGMGDVDARAEFGTFFNTALTQQFSLTSSLRYGAGNGKGLVLDLGAAYAIPLAAQWRLGVGVGASLVNASYMQSYFGVTSAQASASASQYRVYKPEGGLRNMRVNAAATYLVSPRASVTVGVSANTLLGDAADSPLVRKKSIVSGLLAASYAF